MKKSIKLTRFKKNNQSYRGLYFALAGENEPREALQFLYQENGWVYAANGTVLFGSRIVPMKSDSDKMVFRPDAYFNSGQYVKEEGKLYPGIANLIPIEERIKEMTTVGFVVPWTVHAGVILTVTVSGKCYFMGLPAELQEPHFTFDVGSLKPFEGTKVTLSFRGPTQLGVIADRSSFKRFSDLEWFYLMAPFRAKPFSIEVFEKPVEAAINSN